MRTFKTQKGTELQIIDLKGKDYLQVAQRILWFREEKPDWTITTEFVTLTDQSAFAKATISNEEGRIIATGHKEESLKDFAAGYREKAESGAIGRALAHCGYGTQFAPELDEQDRIVDSPQDRNYSQQHKISSSGFNNQDNRCSCGNTMMVSKHVPGTYYCSKCKSSKPIPTLMTRSDMNEDDVP